MLQLERILYAYHPAKPSCSEYSLQASTALEGETPDVCLAAGDSAYLQADSLQASVDADSNSKAGDTDSSSEAGNAYSSSEAGNDDCRDGGTAQALPQAAVAVVLTADAASPADAAALVPPVRHSPFVPAPPAQHATADSAPAGPALAPEGPALAHANPVFARAHFAPASPAPAGPDPAAVPEVLQLFPALSKKRKLNSMAVGCSSRCACIFVCVCTDWCKCYSW